MADDEGFEPPRALLHLSVFKTDPFNRAWVIIRNINYMGNTINGYLFLMVELAGLEPATDRL